MAVSMLFVVIFWPCIFHLELIWFFEIGFAGRKNTIGIPIDASFTSDSNYILTGSSDGYLHIYTNHESRSADDKQIAEISSGQIEAITQVEMNPKYALIATASSYVGLWVPRD